MHVAPPQPDQETTNQRNNERKQKQPLGQSCNQAKCEAWKEQQNCEGSNQKPRRLAVHGVKLVKFKIERDNDKLKGRNQESAVARAAVEKVYPGIELFSQGVTPSLSLPLQHFTTQFGMDWEWFHCAMDTRKTMRGVEP